MKAFHMQMSAIRRSSRNATLGLLLAILGAPIALAGPTPGPQPLMPDLDVGPAATGSTSTPAAAIGDVIAKNRNNLTANAGNYTSYPVINASSAPPLVMLVMSRDEQLFIKAYSDYTDLDGDGKVDTTYNDAFDYSGYFDSDLCYGYASGQFKASGRATGASAANHQKNHQCSSAWSGNFLNWVAMSRLDVLRLVLSGGYRSTDTNLKTVLERAPIPNDLHAWAKVYLGTDVDKFTPFAADSSNPGISFCNATTSSGGAPQMRVARGNWSEWASTALRQCDWKETIGSPNSNNSYNDDASKDNDGLGSKEYTVRVEVCDPSTSTTTIRESFCQRYTNGTSVSYKPVGLLQRYGENGQMRFGLLTGSFSAPRSGGVLRRNIGKIAGNGNDPTTCATGDEIKLSDGTFCNQGSGTEGIINTLNRLSLNQWNFGSSWSDCNTYGILNRNTSAGSTNSRLNDPGTSGSGSQNCSAWGNPLSEMYDEALRYIAADGSPYATFNKTGDLAGLPAPSWQDPYGKDGNGQVRNPYCAACSIIVLSTGLNSFDSDELPPWTKTSIGIDAPAATSSIGADEGINGNNYLVGRVLSAQGDLAVGQPVNTYEDLCTSKTVTNLSLARGICADIPSMEGSYLISGLAYQAWTKDMRPGLKAPNGENRPDGYKNTIQTYAVALAENLPKFQIPVGNGAITLAPLCQANNSGGAAIADSGWRSCYLGAVGIGTKTSRVDTNYIYGRPLLSDGTAGSFSLVWEDSLWGNDHDNDVVSMMTYCVGSTCTRSTSLPLGSTQNPAPKLCFYRDSNYGGAEFCPQSSSGDFSSNMDRNVSSLRVPSGYTVTLYSRTGQRTSLGSYSGDTSALGANNDQARSYSISGGTVPPPAPPATVNTYDGYDICWRSDSAICTDNSGKPAVGTNEVLVRIENLSAYAGNAMLTGYTVTGSNSDGVKRLTLRPGSSDSSVLTAQTDPPANWYKPKVFKYTLGSSGAKQLQNPLFYAAKYGGFTKVADSSGNLITQPCDSTTTPACATSNWDRVNNDTGLSGGDGVPDNFFPVRNPAQLGERLAAVFNAILTRAGSGTSAAVVSSSASGDGLTYQALYQARTQNTDGSQVATWTGALNALWTDSEGRLREGGYNPGGVPTLGDYTQNPIVVFCTTQDGDSRFLTYTDVDSAPRGAIDPAACTGQSLDKLKTVWSAQTLLASPAYEADTQRNYGAVANATNGRYIFTWIDADHNGVVDAGEQKDFAWDTNGFGGTGACDTTTVTGNFRYLNTCSAAGAQALVDWMRGDEYLGADGKPDPAWRSRTVDGKVYRLGDIINSTPLSVSTPAEAFDLLYNDQSYGKFRKVYQQRRQMIYVGANDGMLHAFNGGFYNAATKSLEMQPQTCDGSSCSLDTDYTAHPLGAEVWAYVPGNLLPHLRWLADPAYAHMFYVDGSPISQDVRVFTSSDDCTGHDSTQCHPDGWGTILIVPFRFGGGPITLDTQSGTDVTQQSSFPAYVVLDVTNPEAAPVVLAELTNTDGTSCDNKVVSCADLSKVVSTYTSSLPAVAMFRQSGTSNPVPSKFFLFTGSGTTDNGGVGSVEGGGAVSSTALSLRGFDLSDIGAASHDPTPITWSNGKTVESFANVGSTGAGSSSFAGDLIASDYDLNGLAESLYFGSTKGSASPFGGSLWAIDFNGSADPGDWLPRQVISGMDKPVTIRPTLGVNARQQHMVFFGTGRVFTKSDLSDKSRQAIVGLVDEGGTTDYSKLLDETDVEVDAEGNVSGAGSIDNVTALEAAGVASCTPASDGSVPATCGGWTFKLEVPKDASNASLPAERVISTQVLSGGVLTTTTYLPGTDLCTDQGEGRMYPMNYQSGTGDPGLAGLLGTTGTDKTLNKYVKLGKGLPSQPSLHKGGTGESGDQQLRVCVQTSSGAIICHDLPPLKGVNSGEISWREPVDK